jgi:hypothetical protein
MSTGGGAKLFLAMAMFAYYLLDANVARFGCTALHGA